MFQCNTTAVPLEPLRDLSGTSQRFPERKTQGPLIPKFQGICSCFFTPWFVLGPLTHIIVWCSRPVYNCIAMTIEFIFMGQYGPLEVLPVEVLRTMKYYAYQIVADSISWRRVWLRVYLCVFCLSFQGEHHDPEWEGQSWQVPFLCESVPRGPLSHNLSLVPGMMWWKFWKSPHWGA